METIQRGVRALEAPAHRLQLIHREGDIIILDDSYNINPDGAKAALDVLALFKNRRKIVLTHGLVELGKLEEEMNEDFGSEIAKVADIAIITGPQAPLLRKGLIKAKFSEEKIVEAKNISEASQKLRRLAKEGDIILIQTDLPDSYY